MAFFRFNATFPAGRRTKEEVKLLQDTVDKTLYLDEKIKDNLPYQIRLMRNNLVNLQNIELALYSKYVPLDYDEIKQYLSDLYTNKDPISSYDQIQQVPLSRQNDTILVMEMNKLRNSRWYLFKEFERVENQIKMVYDKIDMLERKLKEQKKVEGVSPNGMLV